MIIAVIVGCEIGFWVAVAAGLVARYVLKQPRLGAILLASVPVIDMVLLVAVAIDLRAGAIASWEHTLAAFYLGFSLVCGHGLIRWADVRFAHWFSGGPVPVKRIGGTYARQCWVEFGQSLLMCAIAIGVIQVLIWWAPERNQVEALLDGYDWAAVLLGVNFLWALSYTVWPRKASASA